MQSATKAIKSVLQRSAPKVLKNSQCGAVLCTQVAERFAGGISSFSGPVVQTRGFSNLITSQEDDEGEPVELTEALASEIAEEAAEQDVDPELEDVKSLMLKTFDIEDTAGRGIVILRSKEGVMPNGESIEIVFDCQDEAEGDGMDGMDAFEGLSDLANGANGDTNSPSGFGEDDDEDADDIGFGINFNVAISKPNGDQLLIDAVAGQQLDIQGIQYVSAENNKTLQSGSDGEIDHELYGGPVFDQLDEGLQDAFYDYLEDRHIDDDLCFFVLSYARHKEQAEYVNWLQNVLKFAET